jgi:hypothetical protein
MITRVSFHRGQKRRGARFSIRKADRFTADGVVARESLEIVVIIGMDRALRRKTSTDVRADRG